MKIQVLEVYSGKEFVSKIVMNLELNMNIQKGFLILGNFGKATSHKIKDKRVQESESSFSCCHVLAFSKAFLYPSSV